MSDSVKTKSVEKAFEVTKKQPIEHLDYEQIEAVFGGSSHNPDGGTRQD